MDAVTRRAIRGRHFTFFESKAMITVRVRRKTVDWQIIAQRKASVAVTSATGLLRDILGIQRRSRILRVHDQMFAVALQANGGIANTNFYRIAMDAFAKLTGDFFVALSDRKSTRLNSSHLG